ncbi:MAG TPA: RNA-binding S4 domain-containing protein [Pseudomonadales bacterium]
MSNASRDVLITREPVELYKILKFEGLADNGGAAKALVEQGLVSVNGEVETRKRRQIVAGDVIALAGQTLRITRAAIAAEPAPAPSRQAVTKKRPRLGKGGD